MKILPFALVLSAASSPLAAETQKVSPIIENTRNKTEGIVSQESSGKLETGVILGCLLLGSAAGAWASSQYERKTPPEKRITARVLEKL